MNKIYRCPKCDARFNPPCDGQFECPHCGIWFNKWIAGPAMDAEPAAAEANVDAEPFSTPDPLAYFGRLALLVFMAIWGARLAAMDYRDAEINGSFMHAIVLPIHEAGHIFFIPFGQFMTILGGSLFQLALPLAIGAAFLLRQRDPFGAAVCVWWAGASMVDLSPYIWDALAPQMMLLGGHTGEDGPHDWIYLLNGLGQLHNAQHWGAIAHTVGGILMLAALVWALAVLRRQHQLAGNNRETE